MKDFLKALNIDFSIFIVGLLSGVIAMNNKENKSKSLWERFVVGLTGACSAVFLTPLIVWGVEVTFQIKIPHAAQLGIAYMVGQLGLEAVKRLFAIAVQLKDLKK